MKERDETDQRKEIIGRKCDACISIVIDFQGIKSLSEERFYHPFQNGESAEQKSVEEIMQLINVSIQLAYESAFGSNSSILEHFWP